MKKKVETIGTISGYELGKKCKPKYEVGFKTGGFQTEKDKPRKKFKPHNIDKLM